MSLDLAVSQAHLEAGAGRRAARIRELGVEEQVAVEEQLAAMAKLHREGFLSSEEFDDVAE